MMDAEVLFFEIGGRALPEGKTDKKENPVFLIQHILGHSEWSSCKVIYEEGLTNI